MIDRRWTIAFALGALGAFAPSVASAEPPQTHKRHSWVIASEVLAGLTVVDAGLLAYTQATALGDQKAAVDQCAQRACDSRAAIDATTQIERAYAFAIVGTLLAGATAAVYLAAPEDRVTLTPSASPQGFGLAIGGKF